MTGFPHDDEVLEMSPEDLGPFVLRYLAEPANDGRLNRYNFGQSLPRGQVGQCYMEAWMWLEREGFIAPKPGDIGDWVFVTRRGQQAAEAENFDAYRHASMFPDGMDPVLVSRVRPIFVRGDYDTAVFRAFKEVEVRVRHKAGLSDEEIGRDLMNKALGPNGPLKVATRHKDDQSAIRELFAGAISACKNPSSHHEVQFEDPREAADMIIFANHLLRIIGRLQVAP